MSNWTVDTKRIALRDAKQAFKKRYGDGTRKFDLTIMTSSSPGPPLLDPSAMSEAHVNGKLHTRDESAIIGALVPMFGSYDKKQDLQFEKDGFDVQIHESDEKFLLSAAVGNKTADEAIALVGELGRRLEAAGIPYSLEVQDDADMFERFEWSPT